MEADHLRRLMATTKEALSKCDDEVVIFLLEKAKRRGINIEGENPVDLAVKGFCELMIQSYPPDLASKIIAHFEHLQQTGRLGAADGRTVRERMEPFVEHELDIRNGFPKPTKHSRCTNYVMLADPQDAKSAAKAVLADSGDISERNILTANALLKLPTETKSVWYIGETIFYWPERCKPNFDGYKGNRVLYHLLRDKKIRIIAFNMHPAFQSSAVSKGIKKVRLLCIEMLWHINTNAMAVLGQGGSLCKVLGGGVPVTSSASRLYRFLECPSLLPDGHQDLFRWIQQDIDEEEKCAICVKSFEELERVKEEMKLPHNLHHWFYRHGFYSVIPSGTSLKEVIEAPSKASHFRSFKRNMSSGRLCYYHPLYQPKKPMDIYRLTFVENRWATPLDEGLAQKVFDAYRSSSLMRSKLRNQPAVSVAHDLAKRVAEVVDAPTGFLTSELESLIKDAESEDDEDDEDTKNAEDAMLKFMTTHDPRAKYK